MCTGIHWSIVHVTYNHFQGSRRGQSWAILSYSRACTSPCLCDLFKNVEGQFEHIIYESRPRQFTSRFLFYKWLSLDCNSVGERSVTLLIHSRSIGECIWSYEPHTSKCGHYTMSNKFEWNWNVSDTDK